MKMFRSLSVNTFVNTSNESIMLPNKDLNTFFNGIVNFLNIVNLKPSYYSSFKGVFLRVMISICVRQIHYGNTQNPFNKQNVRLTIRLTG